MVNFPKQPRTTEDGARCKGVILQKADLCEFVETMDTKTLARPKEATDLPKTTK